MRLRTRITESFSTFVPSGLIAETEKGFFYIKGDKRFKFVSDKARESWGLKIVKTKEQYLANIKISGIIGFRDGTMLKDFGTRKYYLISDNKRYHIADPDIIDNLGYSKKDIMVVSTKECSIHKEGGTLNG